MLRFVFSGKTKVVASKWSFHDEQKGVPMRLQLWVVLKEHLMLRVKMIINLDLETKKCD